MKNVKKLPTKQLEKFSTIFIQLGLVLVLFIVYLTLEHKTLQKSAAIYEPEVREPVYVGPDTEIIFQIEKVVKPKLDLPKQQPLILDEPLKKVDNKTAETVILQPIVEPVSFDINTLITVKEPEKEEPTETVPYISIQNVPVFKGCEGLSKEENKKCFDKKMKKFVKRNFDASIANDLGLNSGKYKIQTQFIIDVKGNVVDIKIRAPHKRLKKQTKDLIEKLPKFTPGMQQNKPVKVRYNLPISFLVD